MFPSQNLASPKCLLFRETEIKQLQGWKGTVENLIEKFHEALAVAFGASASGGSEEGSAVSTAAAVAAAAEDGDEDSKPEENGDSEVAVVEADAVADGNEDTAMTDAAEMTVVAAAENGDAPPASDEAAQAAWEEAAAEAEWGHLSAHQHMQLAKLRVHFHKDVRKQLYGDAEDKQFFEWLKQVQIDLIIIHFICS